MQKQDLELQRQVIVPENLIGGLAERGWGTVGHQEKHSMLPEILRAMGKDWSAQINGVIIPGSLIPGHVEVAHKVLVEGDKVTAVANELNCSSSTINSKQSEIRRVISGTFDWLAEDGGSYDPSTIGPWDPVERRRLQLSPKGQERLAELVFQRIAETPQLQQKILEDIKERKKLENNSAWRYFIEFYTLEKNIKLPDVPTVYEGIATTRRAIRDTSLFAPEPLLQAFGKIHASTAHARLDALDTTG